MRDRHAPSRRSPPPDSYAKAKAFLLVVLACLAAGETRAQHLGIYHWGGVVDSLPRANAEFDRFGADTIRIFLGGKYDYLQPENAPYRFPGLPRPLTLTTIAMQAPYRALFENPKIHTVWLTAYPVFDYGKGPVELDLRRKPSPAEWRQETFQMAELVDMLYRNYGSQERVVLLSNNETDEKLREISAAGGDIQNEIRYLAQLRMGVETARRSHPDAKLKVLFGVEAKFWKSKLPNGINALESVLPQLHYDFVSFSAWEVEEHPEKLGEALDDIARRTRPQLTPLGRAVFGDHHVLVGEFGYAREWKIPPAPIFQAFLDALRSGRTPYAVYWQLYDNAQGAVKQFGLVDPQDHLTIAGKTLRQVWGSKKDVQ
jgi:hypothetical protein